MSTYNPTTQHFEIGDDVWWLRDYWVADGEAIVKATITSYYQSTDGAYIFYSVRPHDITRFEIFWNYLSYQWWKIRSRFNPKIGFVPHWKYGGRSYVAGENIFWTRNDAFKAYIRDFAQTCNSNRSSVG